MNSSCSKYHIPLLHSTPLNSLAGKKKSGKYRNELPCELSFLSLLIYSRTAVIKLSEFIQSDVPSNTLLLIPNEFGIVFELGVQRTETLKKLERHSRSRSEEHFITYHDSHRISVCLSPAVSLSLQSAL